VGGHLEETIEGVVGAWIEEEDGRRNTKSTYDGLKVCRHSEDEGETAMVAAEAHHHLLIVETITITILVGGHLEETTISPSPTTTRATRVVTRSPSKVIAKATIPPRAKATTPPRAKRLTTTTAIRTKRLTTKMTTTRTTTTRGRIRHGKTPKARRRVHQRGTILILLQRLGSARGKFVSIWQVNTTTLDYYRYYNRVNGWIVSFPHLEYCIVNLFIFRPSIE
jgi:hypothetical protein